jgi:NitT/TauT family transport system permease protein
VLALVQYFGPISAHAWQTFWTTMVGFGIGVLVGVALGFVVGSSRFMYAGLYPLLVGFNSIPKAALVPILVVWFGSGTVPAILTAFLICFFPILVNVATGLATLEPELEDVLRALGAKRMDVLLKVGLPRSLPYFFASLKVAITLAFVGAVISEITASNEGIGYLMMSAGSSMRMPLVFAGLLVISFMAIAMYGAFAFLERRMTGWATRGMNAPA